jgi:cysteine desulfurase
VTVKRTYFDYNASAPLVPQAREAITAALALTGNPSSVHREGRKLRGIIEAAREEVAALLHAKPSEVVFTSGATESNVMALDAGWDAVLMAGIEHESVLAPVRASSARIVEVPVMASGLADTGAIAAHILKSPLAARTVVALQMANNETGVIQAVAEVAAFGNEHGVSIHTDAVQVAGRVAVDFEALGVDTMSVSAHKIGGPKGVGALVIRDGFEVASLIRGGGQERRRRAGTENVAAIAGFGAAAKLAAAELADMPRMAALRDRLERALLQATPSAVVFGHDAVRLPNTCCIGVPGRSAEIVVIKLDVAGFAVSAGSACSSGKVGASHVLAAMGADEAAAKGAIRISLGRETTGDEIDAFLAQWREIHTLKAGPLPPAARHTTGGWSARAVSAIGD